MTEDKTSSDMERIPATDEAGIRKTFTTPDINLSNSTQGKTKYPWRSINVGESFEILHSEMGKKTVAPYVSKMSKKYGKKFKLTDCPQYNCYLISCLPQTTEEAVATSSTLFEALDKIKGNGGE